MFKDKTKTQDKWGVMQVLYVIRNKGEIRTNHVPSAPRHGNAIGVTWHEFKVSRVFNVWSLLACDNKSSGPVGFAPHCFPHEFALSDNRGRSVCVEELLSRTSGEVYVGVRGEIANLG
jgi:hypothetical protein